MGERKGEERKGSTERPHGVRDTEVQRDRNREIEKERQRKRDGWGDWGEWKRVKKRKRKKGRQHGVSVARWVSLALFI